jgi:hypothetical protein
LAGFLYCGFATLTIKKGQFIFILEFNRFRLTVIASFACGNEPSCYTKGQGILNKQSNCKVVKKTAPWDYLLD